jgi:hypothetical protein
MPDAVILISPSPSRRDLHAAGVEAYGCSPVASCRSRTARLFPAPFRPSIRQVGTSGMNEIGLSGRSSLGTSRNCTADQFREHRLVVGLARDQSHQRGIIPVIPTGGVTFARRQKLRQSFLLALVRHASIIRSRSDPTEGSTPVCAGYTRSPGDSRRWAATARSLAALAPYRSSIWRLRQPASRMRSLSPPPPASQLWAKVCRS